MTNVLRYIIYGGATALLLMPFIVTGSMYFPFITGKAFYFRIITEIIFGAWVVLALYNPKYRPKLSWLSVAMLAMVFVPLLGVVFGINTTDAIWSNFERMIGWITILHVGMLFAAVSHTLEPKHWHWLFYTSLAVSVVVGIQGLTEIPDTNRIDADLGNPIYLAMYSLWHVFLAGFYLLQRVKKATKKAAQSLLLDWQVYAFSLLGAFNLIVMWFTGTRGAILGLLAGLFVGSLVVALFQKNRQTIRKLATAGVILPVVAVGLFFGFRDTEFMREQPVLGRFAQIDLQEGNAAARLDTWAIGLEGYTERPLVGWGMGNFNYVFDKHYDPAMHDDAEWFDRAHNVLVEWLVAAGPLGLLAYLSLFGAAVYLIWRKPEDGWQFSVAEKAILIGLLTAYLVQNLFVFDHLVSYTMFALLLGWLHARSPSDFGWKRLSGWPNSRAAKDWLAMTAVVAVLVTGYAWNYPAIMQAQTVIDGLRSSQTARRAFQQGQQEQATRLFEQAQEDFAEAISYQAMGTQEARERLTQTAQTVAQANGPTSSVAQNFFALADANMRTQIDQEPQDVRHRVFYGNLLSAYEKYDQAIEQLTYANDRSGGQKQSILFSLAEAHEGAGNQERALELYKQAYDLPTEFDDVAVRYAAALARYDQLGTSDDVLNEHFGTTTVANQRLIEAYEAVGAIERTIPLLEERLQEAKEDRTVGLRDLIQRYVSLAAGYEQVGNTEEAITTLEEVIAQYPQAASQIEPIIERIESGEEVSLPAGS
jgi:O-antigen ligase/TolA-binding protein